MIINDKIYKNKIMACWLGKNIGGTLGAPMENFRQENIVEGYTQNFDNPLPNDDLDLQLLWLIALEEKGINATPERLGEYWQRYITPHWSEYGIAKVNMKSAILPPMSGTVNNQIFKDSNGAWIRSEIWACLAPGRPDIAVMYAVRDAVIDHGNGEGTWAEVFCTALQSAAFVNNNISNLIDIALTYIPENSGLYTAIKDGIKCYNDGMTLKEARHYMLTVHRGHVKIGKPISEEDLKNGFEDGVHGYDCPLNVAIVIMGLLYGGDNFDKVIKSTIFFGEDTDCTVATAAATYGLIYGYERIDKRWSEPIGNRIVTGCLNLGELGPYGAHLPHTIEELTERVHKQHLKVAKDFKLYCADKKGFDTSCISSEKLFGNDKIKDIITHISNNIIFNFDFYSISIDYGEDCSITTGIPKKVVITVKSTYKTADILNLRWLVPEDVSVSPYKSGRIFLMLGGYIKSSKVFDIEFTSLSPKSINRYILEITIDGRTTAMYVPIVLHNVTY